MKTPTNQTATAAVVNALALCRFLFDTVATCLFGFETPITTACARTRDRCTAALDMTSISRPQPSIILDECRATLAEIAASGILDKHPELNCYYASAYALANEATAQPTSRPRGACPGS